MINLFGAEYGFLAPWALLALPALTSILAYAYLKRGRTARVIVPSLMFLKLAERRLSKPRRFVPPWRFYFELLLLLLFVLGIASLVRTDIGNVYVFLIDNSLSMGARSGQGDRLLDQAQKDARAVLNGLNATAQVEIYNTSPVLRRVAKARASQSELTTALKAIEPFPAIDNLEEQIASLLKDERLHLLSVYSERVAQRARPALTDQRVDYHQSSFSSSSQSNFANIAIIDASASFTDANGAAGKNDSVRLHITVANFGGDRIKLHALLEELTLQDEMLVPLNRAEQLLDLPAGQREQLIFSVKTTQSPTYRVTIKADLTSGRDSIDQDNSAYFALNSISNKITLVGPLTPQQLGLEGIPSVNFDYLSPPQYLNLKEADTANGTYLFHRMMPQHIPKAHSAIIMPPSSAEPIEISNSIKSAEITKWDPDHSLLTYLNLAELQLDTVRVISRPDWADLLLNTSKGAVLISGMTNGHRLAVLGFEIFPFEGSKSPFMSVLTLNLIKWLNDSQSTLGYVPSNTVFSRTAKLDLLTASSSSNLAISGTSDLSFPGVYRITDQGGSSKLIASNFFNEVESNVSLHPTISLPESQYSDLKLSAAEPLTQKIALFVLFLLILDMLMMRIIAKARRTQGVLT